MNRVFIFFILFGLGACATSTDEQQEAQKTSLEPTTVVSEIYELVMPQKQEGFLILFPCFPCYAENTRAEFNIIDIAIANNISVLLMNFNQHLWLDDAEKKELEKIILHAVNENNSNNAFIGK